MNLVFLLKDELGLLNRRQKGTSFVSCRPIAGMVWGPGEQGFPAGVQLQRARREEGCLGVRCLAHSSVEGAAVWGSWGSWEAEGGCSPLPARPEGPLGFYLFVCLDFSIFFLVTQEELPSGVVWRAMLPCVCVAQWFSFSHLLTTFLH